MHSVYGPEFFEPWRQALAPIYAVAQPRSAAFSLDDTSWQLPHGFLDAARGSPIVLRRDAALIATHPLDAVSLFRLTRGKVVSDYDGRAATLRRGDMVFLDYARPIRSRSSAYTCQSATVPRERVPLRGQRGDLHGIVLPGASPLGQLLGRQLDSLVEGMGALDSAQAEAAFAAFVDYAVRFWPAPDGTFADAALIDRAMAIIADDLCDPDLTPGLIAKRLRVSRAGLYAAFAERGGISTVIQAMRLDAALQMLVRERRHAGLVGRAAKRHAFQSVAHFSRAFTLRFGRAPIDVIDLTHRRVGGLNFREWLVAGTREANMDTMQAWLDGTNK